MSVLSQALNGVEDLIGLRQSPGQDLVSAPPQAAPANLITRPPNDHSTRDRILTFLFQGPGQLTRDLKAHDQQQDAQRRAAAAIQESFVDGQLDPDAYVKAQAKYGFAPDPKDYLALQQGLAQAAARKAKNIMDVGPNHKVYNADLDKVVLDNAEPYTLAAGSKRFGGDNQEVASAPFEPELRTVGEGQNLVEVNPNSAPATSRGMRNNNPLNLTNLPDGQWAGQVGTDGRFAVFSSPEAGIAAADKNLQTYAAKHGINTVAGVINRWAPSSENDTQAYVATVAGDLGVRPDEPLNLADPAVRMKVLRSMARVEVGGSPPAMQGGARVVASGPPKQSYRPATAEEKAAYGLPDNVPAKVSPDGNLEVIPGFGANLKPIPQNIMRYVSDTRTAIKNIDDAIAAVKAHPHAFGFGNAIPGAEQVTQYLAGDAGREGIAARAKVTNISSQVRHDRSGAAVTAAETPYLKPFLPHTSDTADAVISKLQELRRRYAAEQDSITSEFSPDSGYRSLDASGLPSGNQGGQQPIRLPSGMTPAQAKATYPSGTPIILPDGRRGVVP